MLSDSYVKKEFDSSFSLEEERKAALLEEMGLDGTDVEKLRKEMLSHEEAVEEKEKELLRIRQHKGLKDDWEEFLDRKRRMGRMLHHSEFISLLREAIPGLLVLPGRQLNRIGLYKVINMPTKEVQGYKGGGSHAEVPVYIGWIEEGIMPEYEVDLVNDAGVAVGQWRGWRTILLRLIARRSKCAQCQQGEKPKVSCGRFGCGRPTSIIDEATAEKIFGFPTNGATASWYRRTLWQFRNGVR